MVSLLFVAFVLLFALTWFSLIQGLTPVEQIEAQLNPITGLLLQPARVYDRSGSHVLVTLAPTSGPRTFLSYAQFPASLVNATLALSQPDFWQSPGYVLADWQDPQAHPTLAQGLAFNFLLEADPQAPLSALHERLLAAQLTNRYGREQVLEWVLNSTDYGYFAYGAEAAARLYFGKNAADLSLSESALLAAVGQSPSLNPFVAPQAAEASRLESLQAMLALGWITPEEAAQAAADPPALLPPPPDRGMSGNMGVSPQFIDLLLRQLDAAVGTGRLQRGGVVIFTSLEYDLQLQADCALRLQSASLTAGETPVSALDGSPCLVTDLFTPANPLPGPLTSGALVLDPLSGQILAAAGDLSPQPAGTTLTPFLYLTAFTRGYSPSSLVWDLPGSEPVLGQVAHGPLRLRIALANDYLTPAATLLAQMGSENVRLTASSFGLTLPPDGLLQQDFAISPFELANAHAILAAGGVQFGQSPSSLRLEPAAVLRVARSDGTLWLDWSIPAQRLVVSPQLAYLLNHVLSDEVARWPSLGQFNPLELGLPAAVKVSRSLDGSGAWVSGYTPRRVILLHLSGAGAGSQDAAASLWNALARYALRDQPSEAWQMPSGVVTVKVCDPSGDLPTDLCPGVVTEVFLEGRQPTQPDMLFQAFQVNLETGMLATVFTPPELVESRVYMMVPAQARPWAVAVGLEAPPTMYDAYRPSQVLPGAHITSPSMFSMPRGLVEVRGTAAGQDFLSYRLQFGAGLNPEYWTMLGESSTTPVTGGLLGAWDTSGLDGLYTMRLVVVRKGNIVERAVTQVTLDNTPPQVEVLYPQADQVLLLSQEAQVPLLARLQDPFLAEAVFYVDGLRVGSVSTAPYGLVWQARAGEHVLRITSTDRAGNVGAAEIHFTVK